jgi:hypothetical protein
MARGIKWNGVSLPVTDTSITFTRDPIKEQSMSGLGGEKLYGGVYGSGQGSLSGAYRPSVFNTYISYILDPNVSAYIAVVSDDHDNCLTGTDSYFTSVEITLKSGELAKISMNFVSKKVTAEGTVSSASYTAAVPVFYNSACDWGQCSAFTIKIERPYTADDYKLGGDNFYSDTIYQSGETSISGTITLSQTEGYDSLNDPSTLEFTLSGNSITVSNAVLSGAELSSSGRGLINKTFNWAAPSTGVTLA